MRIIIDDGFSKRIFSATNLDESTTVEQLLKKAGLDERDWQEVWVDGTRCQIDLPCRQVPLLEGSLISNDNPVSQVSSDKSDGVWEFVIIAGQGTGLRYRLPTNGSVRLGRSSQANIVLESNSVSWSHAIITVNEDGVWISDDNSSNGTWVNGNRLDTEAEPLCLGAADVIGIGGIYLQLKSYAEHKPARLSARNSGVSVVAFNRPPRPALPNPPEPLELPVKKDAVKPAKFSWIAILAPLLMAVAMVAVMGSARYAMIAMLSPVMAVGSWWEQKRRAKANEKEIEEEYVKSLKTLENAIDDAAEEEKRRLEATIPYPHSYRQTVEEGGPCLWQVRSGHDDFWHTNLGVSTRGWQVPTEHNNKPQPRTKELIDKADLRCAPLDIDLGLGPVGIWGERNHGVAIARSLICQTMTRSGPADTTLVVLSDKARAPQWQWTWWLPHTMVGGANPNDRWIAANSESAQSMARALRDRLPHMLNRHLFIVVDDLSLLQGKDAPVRDLFNYQPPQHSQVESQVRITGIVLADRPEALPACCYTVVEARTDSSAQVSIPSTNVTVKDVTTCSISIDMGYDWARALARFEDPELSEAGAALPSLVHLFDLLELDRNSLSSDDIKYLWATRNGFNIPLGVSEDGIFYFDIVKDGPHGLVGGTTGSGKSELLRSLVAGLAARVSPEELTFILVDFKGGAAFASLDQLPHTIGTLSNLEASLAYRALHALEAEMRYRQECFAKAGEGIDNLDAYLKTNPEEPMPRLLVVVDEFAQLAKEYPDVLQALVSIGAVGRTLGVHMILATQRPAGVVNEDILANTNMRTALRVQSREDSTNVISVPAAASIGREQKGRAYIKLGEDDITPIQTALVTGVSGQKNATDLYLDEVELGQSPPEHILARDNKQVSDMDLLISTIKDASEQLGYRSPRPVWPEPLGETVVLSLADSTPSEEIDGSIPVVNVHPGKQIIVGLADDPDHQRQYATGWNLEDANLILAGIAGSGTTTTLSSLALSIAFTRTPETTDMLFLDLGSKGLEILAGLPHCRGYAGPGSVNLELQTRLLRYVIKETDNRASNPGSYPDLFVFIDGLANLKEQFDDYDGIELLQGFYQAWAKGPTVGIHYVASTTRLKALPGAIDEVTPQKWLFHLADPYDYSLAGIAKDNLPAHIPGRFVNVTTGHHTHVATPSSVDKAVRLISDHWNVRPKPALIATLPTQLFPNDIASLIHISENSWILPVGMAEDDLSICTLQAWAGEHILVAGPARSGKTSVLTALARMLAKTTDTAGNLLKIVGIVSRRSSLICSQVGEIVNFDQASGLLAQIMVSSETTVLLIDDAHMFSDPDGQLAGLLTNPRSNLLIIAAGRNDDLRSQYGQWTNQLRKSRLGILLQPNRDFDGELLNVTLPRKTPVKMSTGRGYACQDGIATLIQSVGEPA